MTTETTAPDAAASGSGANPEDPSVLRAQHKVAQLGAQIDALQSVLVRLLQDVVQAEARLDNSVPAQVVEANEQLVLSAIRSQAEADTASQALRDVEQTTALDALTGLPNRVSLLDRFDQVVSSARRHGHSAAVLFVDLDRFKPVNDDFGHAFGDEVLRRVATRMLSAVREVDTVSRHGGDEFVILLAELTQPADAHNVVAKLMQAIGAPMAYEGREVRMSASIGIALFPADGERLSTLIEHADASMYEAKRARASGPALQRQGPVPAPPAALAGPPVRTLTEDPRLPDERLDQLREANERLVLAALSARELQVAAEQAQRRQAAFVAAAADELSNPMAPIRIAAAMLGRHRTDEPVMGRVHAIVEQQMTRMARLLGHVMAASNGDEPVLRLDLQPVDLAALVDEVLDSCRPLLREQHKLLGWQRPSSALMVQGDDQRLRQVVDNLMDNATRFTYEGGHIDVTLKRRTEVGGDLLSLTVSDDGIGITPRVLPQVFDPFVQDIRALGLHAAGIGLGLTVVRELVRAHGGDLVAYSDGVGCGSRFVVTLPQNGSVAPEAAPAG